MKDNGISDKIENVPHNVITSSISGDGAGNIPQMNIVEKVLKREIHF